jgi:anti-sigma-K factor RskA
MQIYLDPASRRMPLADASGTLAVDPTGQGALVVRHLPAAPAGKTYEAWVIPRGSKPIRAGVFAGGDPMTMLPLDASVPKGAVVAATVERTGGVEAPTGQPVFTAQT